MSAREQTSVDQGFVLSNSIMLWPFSYCECAISADIYFQRKDSEHVSGLEKHLLADTAICAI